MLLIPTNLPNGISFARLIASPVFVFLFWMGLRGSGYGSTPEELVRDLNVGYLVAAWALMFLQEASDLVDGWIARRQGIVTDLGKLVDPLADALSHVGALLCLMWVGLIPFWVLVVVYYREAVVGTLRVLAAKEGYVVQARPSGKVKSLTLAVAANTIVGWLVVSHWVEGLRVFVGPVAFGLGVLVSLGSLVSLVDYYRAVSRLVKQGGGSPRGRDPGSPPQGNRPS
ncbi:CDP-alcohol phosphatidyltransferase family protein [Myxococcota bacterium]|jgi:CDP-diacylglycerol--glycerol-3-phosphate 3-phosphatidyltransferase|nr:CDP-alcohol phosphatidyltransferase family protein [Myxococcota bacterium]